VAISLAIGAWRLKGRGGRAGAGVPPTTAVVFGQRHRQQPECAELGEDVAGKGVVMLSPSDTRHQLPHGEVAGKADDRLRLRCGQHSVSRHTGKSTRTVYSGIGGGTTLSSMTPPSARRRQLLDELVDVFLAEGFRSLTLADLANRLHVSKTTLYQLGHSKEQITINAILLFFRRAADSVEAATAVHAEPAERITAYLKGVATALRPASPTFMTDLEEHPATCTLYERNTRAAAERVKDLIAEGIDAGAFRKVHGAFVADTVADTMLRIQTGAVLTRTGLRDAQAYEQLADLVVHGIRS
jgi:AcrR family transcriptional regulator